MPIQLRDNRGGNWWWAHNALFDTFGPQIGPYGIAVYCCLCRHAGRGQETWIAQGSIAREIGASRTQVNRTIARLAELGLVAVEGRVDETGRNTSVYSLTDPGCVPGVYGGAVVDSGGGAPVQRKATPGTANQFMNKTQGTRAPQRETAPRQHDKAHFDAIRERWERQQDVADGGGVVPPWHHGAGEMTEFGALPEKTRVR